MTGTITGNDILDRVQQRLLDLTGEYWSRESLEVELAASFNAIIVKKPDAHTRNERMRLAEGVFQQLPPDGYALIDVRRNLGSDGLTPGRAILESDFKDMDRADPDWMNAETTDVVENYVHDSRDPTVFYVYPPASFPGAFVDVVYSAAVSPRYTDPAQPIPLNDVYEDAIFYYVLMQAFAKDSQRGDPAKSRYYAEMMMSALGGQTASQAVYSADTPPGSQQQ